jgi:sterol desaturase/sphingolipid hydroxylase (fatty acid hydroxylase superfamily)
MILMRDKAFPGWLSGPLFIAAGAAILRYELRRPLRSHTEPKLRRAARNITVALLAGVALQFADKPVTSALMNFVERRDWGLFRRLRLPILVEIAAAGAVLDYSMYLWHVLLHRVPLLWRFHIVHHCDLDLDISTALRFHFGELLFSIPLRAVQIAVVGPSRFTFTLWQTCFGLAVFFHHSEVTLPLEWERYIVRAIVTPRMHGIHHSIVQSETDSNWSSGLTIWDRLHGTLRLNVPQQAITVGVPAFRKPEQVTVPVLVTLPFQHQLQGWELPDGSTPERQSRPGRTRLSA